MPIPTQQLREQAAAYGLTVSEELAEQFSRYGDFLVERNQQINLTAITDPQEMAVKHFLDSLIPAVAAPLPKGAKIIDVGTGAGFPGVPLKLYRPDCSLFLLDSLNKRVVFLRELCALLGIEAEAFHSRAEEAGKNPQLREQFDYATARAVAGLRELTEYCLPFVKVGGVFVALKGYEVEEEVRDAQKAISLLGGRVEEIKKVILPGENRRALVVIRKASSTPAKYPRPSAKIAKNPLR